MPTNKLRLTKTEDQENRTRLSRLEEMGIPIEHAGDPSPELDWLTLEQSDYELPRIYELPLKEVAVVLSATMTILTTGKLITKTEMMAPWDDWPLKLNDLEGRPYYQHLIRGLSYPTILLNNWLTGEAPLRPGQVKGAIIAYGYISIPSQYHDESPVTVELLVRDGRRNELSSEFGVRVDRSLMRRFEQRQREDLLLALSRKGPGLYEPKKGQPGDQKNVSQGKPSSSRMLAVNMTPPTTQELLKPN